MANQGFSGMFKKQESRQDDELGMVIRDVTRRLRVLEERIATDRKNIQLNQQNVLTASKKVNQEIKTTFSDVNELRKEISELKDKLSLVSTALNETVKKEDVKVLEKYIELWEPLNFVTQKEVESLIRKIIYEYTNQKAV